MHARLLAPLVLLGLWMMHGMSATTEAGCHGMPMPTLSMSVASTDVGPAPAAVRATEGVSGVETPARAAPGGFGQTGSGETCLSGQPPSPGGFLLGLLAALALVGLAFDVNAFPTALSRWTRPEWRRGPPGPVGRALLNTVCISRT